MPRWVRWLQPLLSGVFTVDNLDFVRRDAYLTGVSIGPVDVERLRRYTFISDRGLTLYESGIAALEMFLTARRFIYQQVYFHRTVRAIDLDLRDVFGPSVRAIFGDGSPADRLSAYADLDEYALLHQAARWARGESLADRPVAGDGTVTRAIADAWRAILLRRPTWRAEAEFRAEYEAGGRPDERIAALGAAEPGGVAIDLAEVDARPGRSGRGRPRAGARGPRRRRRSRSRSRSARSRPTGSSPAATGGAADGALIRARSAASVAGDADEAGGVRPVGQHQQRVDPRGLGGAAASSAWRPPGSTANVAVSSGLNSP